MKRWLVVCGVVVALAPQSLEAQTPARLSVGEPVATYGDGLGSMRGVRELSDGRVLIADGLGEAIIVWTPGSGADTLSNIGEGPGEYQVPDGLYPLPDGGTLLVDLGNARLVEVGADLSFGETRPIAQGPLGRGMTLVIPSGTDERGGVYYRQSMGMNDSDSSGIGRFDWATEETAEVGKFKLPPTRRTVSGGANNRSEQVRPVPLRAQDAWGVAWDGRVAVARSDSYRLEWLHPDGSAVSGPAVDYQPVRVGGGEQREWLDNLGGGLGVMMMSDGGPPRLSFSRGGAGDDEADPDDYEWPEVMPAFGGTAVRVAPDGQAWVRRYREAGEPELYDVFDAEGRRVAQLELPEDRSLVGFGDGALYLTRTDGFDFAWLEKYDTPSM